MKLNFEIGPDGKVHPLGYQEKPLKVRLQERLDELNWKPFKSNSKIQPNCCAKFVFEATMTGRLKWLSGISPSIWEKGADNSHLHRCDEIENWAKDVYDWCAKRYGQENIVGFQVHLGREQSAYPCLGCSGRYPPQERTGVCDVVGKVWERPL